MSVFFSKNGSTLSLNKRGEDDYRLALQKPSAQGASLDLTFAEAKEMYEALGQALFAKPKKVDSVRAQAVVESLRAIAAERNTTMETIDKEIASKRVFDKELGKERAMTREEWLAERAAEEVEIEETPAPTT